MEQIFTDLPGIINLILPHLIKEGGPADPQDLGSELAIPVILLEALKDNSLFCLSQGRGQREISFL